MRDLRNGLCECGCGRPTPIAKKTRTKIGHVKGRPVRFIHGHNKGNWKGGRVVVGRYVMVLCPSHPRATNSGHVFEHILIVEQVLGKYLPEKAVVHHVDGNSLRNINSNFVVCEDLAYHNLLHRRMRAYEETGHANWRRCWICKTYDDPLRLYIDSKGSGHHPECLKERARKKKEVV